ncbi:MAG: M48 family metallopeptidase [Alphaproteobacteria bacterium]
MSVYNNIDNNRRFTILIILMFPVVLLALLGAGLGVYYLLVNDIEVVKKEASIVLFFGCIFIIAWFFWILFSINQGGSVILNSAKAKKITKNAAPELYSIVENLAITAGLPCPSIYLIEDESLNAFAVGTKPENAAIAFTTGIVAKLNKSELEAVAAHEMSHIGNRDNYLMTVVVLGIGLFSFLGEILIRSCSRRGGGSRSSGKKKGDAQALILLIGIALLIFGYLIAPLIRFALSRRREFQADATAVLLTRYPEALASALEKIAKDARVENLDTMPNVGALCIANPLAEHSMAGFMSKMAGLTATHPPIEQRIAVLREMSQG